MLAPTSLSLMAPEDDDADQEDGMDGEGPSFVSNGRPTDTGEDFEASEDEEDEEPRLKYASLTKHLKSVYRNGDATSTFLVAGDKMVRGKGGSYELDSD